MNSPMIQNFARQEVDPAGPPASGEGLGLKKVGRLFVGLQTLLNTA